MTAVNSVQVMAFLLFAMLVIGRNLEHANAKTCPQICSGVAAYTTCPASGDEKLTPACNCCFLQTGCKLFMADGTLLCTAN
ncbi:proteinase inhibitor PSI-1.2-like [Olea europaea var. sylvestris]|uniref:proteinase inhibitor PSI-1.2-like n=1 Tax=Olea europaea var. sylvestris TaxID=158386 RepID=UPI000C1D7FDF|nr:proteinase inhibitor PSI-1.2-like [Olea europaea var. sylvestris]